ncbi:unnamed protein product [Prorocentrum cordatum]|uniref:Uncharacterized protein n=1 Tax=Prorocentrum cordatum TaxID=2364126 RepID=A0ABN9X7K3_9DINO|nr:unnamed protein product [Polarella glacialis]
MPDMASVPPRGGAFGSGPSRGDVEAAEQGLLDAAEEAGVGTERSVRALAAAVARAEATPGVDEELLEEACRTLSSSRALLELSGGSGGAEAEAEEDDAEQALASAAAEDDVGALEAAIARAEAAGVCEGAVSAAREALEVLRELAQARADAEESLVTAMCGHTTSCWRPRSPSPRRPA